MTRREFLATLGAGAAFLEFSPPRVRAGGPIEPYSIGDFELRPGDVFTVEGRYEINPVTLKATPYLQQFVVVTVDGCTATCHPQIGEGRSIGALAAKREAQRYYWPPNVGWKS